MNKPFQVVDIFAGPGGLAEGFSAVLGPRGKPFYKLALSVEKETAAHATLTLRAFTRQFPRSKLPAEYYGLLEGRVELTDLREKFPQEWASASKEALLAELGSRKGWSTIRPRLDDISARSNGRTVLIGGPPCQAYSLVGRARNAGTKGYVAEEDEKQFLYKEYIKILRRLRPAAFVMENVKGLLSSRISGRAIFERVLRDLERADVSNGGYSLVALSPEGLGGADLFGKYDPRDFVVRSERFGVPQARHRIFVVGLRRDVADALDWRNSGGLVMPQDNVVTVGDVLRGMPRLRSGLSRADDPDLWREIVIEAFKDVINATRGRAHPECLRAVSREASRFMKLFKSRNAIASRVKRTTPKLRRSSKTPPVTNFVQDPNLTALSCHETRGHIPGDLARYLFCSIFAVANGRSPTAREFPEPLAPAHSNWSSGKFADRFRVQAWGNPATTITSHISKDGHYYIHPDPMQCRSLTVREAARLQTFPDNYHFLGNRTEQYVQVGNAVPPFLAMQIGTALMKLLR